MSERTAGHGVYRIDSAPVAQRRNRSALISVSFGARNVPADGSTAISAETILRAFQRHISTRMLERCIDNNNDPSATSS